MVPLDSIACDGTVKRADTGLPTYAVFGADKPLHGELECKYGSFDGTKWPNPVDGPPFGFPLADGYGTCFFTI